MILSAGQHDNVVGLRGLCKKNNSTYIVLEYCPRGTLDLMVHQTMTNRWETAKVLQVVRAVARGMMHLHNRKPPILHRDLKPGNIFIGHGLVMKIGDFGMSRHIYSEQDDGTDTTSEDQPKQVGRQLTPGVIGTAAYSAPELLDERLQSKVFSVPRILKADVYSFGVLLWEVLTRERPFEGMSYYEIVSQWVTSPDEMRLPPLQIPRDEKLENQNVLRSLSELIAQCTAKDPDNRPDFRTVLKRLKTLQQEIGKAVAEKHV